MHSFVIVNIKNEMLKISSFPNSKFTLTGVNDARQHYSAYGGNNISVCDLLFFCIPYLNFKSILLLWI